VHDNLAVGVGLEDGGLVLETLAKLTVVVDLTVDGEKELAIVRNEGLGTGVCEKGKKGRQLATVLKLESHSRVLESSSRAINRL
jgi:hypothetical protein